MSEHPSLPHECGRRSPASDLNSPHDVFTALIPDLQRAVARQGYARPTPVQEQAIPPLLAGRDLLGSAQTGTGKTAAFALPILQRLSQHWQRPVKGSPRALILAPTRELAAQIGESIGVYGRFLRLRHTVVFGGVKQHSQVTALTRGVDILVATPGRLLDLMGQGHVHLDRVEVFVLDEVDRMLDMGFLPDIRRVLAKVPRQRQTLFFSATLPRELEKLARTMVTDPVRVSIAPEQPAVERIQQKVLFVGKQDKNALLVSLLKGREVSKAIVFTQMKHVANRVVEKLGNAGVSGAAIHGNKSQNARIRALDGFKRGDYRVLVATDVAARGIDVDDITHVINYDLPVEAETYVHRIGRTGRAGADGEAISFCTAEERAFLGDIERLLGNTVPADRTHEFHCEAASRSTLPRPRQGGAARQPRGSGRIKSKGKSSGSSGRRGNRAA